MCLHVRFCSNVLDNLNLLLLGSSQLDINLQCLSGGGLRVVEQGELVEPDRRSSISLEGQSHEGIVPVVLKGIQHCLPVKQLTLSLHLGLDVQSQFLDLWQPELNLLLGNSSVQDLGVGLVKDCRDDIIEDNRLLGGEGKDMDMDEVNIGGLWCDLLGLLHLHLDSSSVGLHLDQGMYREVDSMVSINTSSQQLLLLLVEGGHSASIARPGLGILQVVLESDGRQNLSSTVHFQLTLHGDQVGVMGLHHDGEAHVRGHHSNIGQQLKHSVDMEGGLSAQLSLGLLSQVQLQDILQLLLDILSIDLGGLDEELDIIMESGPDSNFQGGSLSGGNLQLLYDLLQLPVHLDIGISSNNPESLNENILQSSNLGCELNGSKLNLLQEHVELEVECMAVRGSNHSSMALVANLQLLQDVSEEGVEVG